MTRPAIDYNAEPSSAPPGLAAVVRAGANVLLVAEDPHERGVALSLLINIADPSLGLAYIGYDSVTLITPRRAHIAPCPPEEARRVAAIWSGTQQIRLLAMGAPHAAAATSALVVAGNDGLQIVAAVSGWQQAGRMLGVLPPLIQPPFDLSVSVADGHLLVMHHGQ